MFLHSTFLDQLVKAATNDSTEEACECILEYYTSIICGFFSVTFFIENSEEGGLPLFIISSSLPEILEECAHVFNAIRWQCLESFCWDARFTWRLVVSKFGDMMLDVVVEGGIPNGLRVGRWKMSFQDAEVHRCVVTIVNFVAVCVEDLKVDFWHSCNVPSIGVSEVQLLRWSMVGGGSLF
jgi:hypothetical protein